MYSDPQKFINHVSDAIVNSGKPIAGGWKVYEMQVLHKDSPKVQRIETQRAFYAGAQHLYAMIMHGLSAGNGITDKDLERMQNIEKELEVWGAKAMKDALGFEGKKPS